MGQPWKLRQQINRKQLYTEFVELMETANSRNQAMVKLAEKYKVNRISVFYQITKYEKAIRQIEASAEPVAI